MWLGLLSLALFLSGIAAVSQMIDHWFSSRNSYGSERLNCLWSIASDETLRYFTDLGHTGRRAGNFIFEDERPKLPVLVALFASRHPRNGTQSLSTSKTPILPLFQVLATTVRSNIARS